MEHPLKCYACKHNVVCKILDAERCDHYLPNADPQTVGRQIDRKMYQSTMLKLSSELRKTGESMNTLSERIQQISEMLRQYQYTSPQFISILKTMAYLRQLLVTEAGELEKKSKFPPQ